MKHIVILKIYNTEVPDFNYSVGSICLMKLRRIGWHDLRHLLRSKQVRTGFWWGNLRKKPLGKHRCKRKVIFKWILNFRRWYVYRIVVTQAGERDRERERGGERQGGRELW
jgi:hypothetical protein